MMSPLSLWLDEIRRYTFRLAALSTLLLSACTPPPLNFSDPALPPLEAVAALSPGTRVAWSPDSRFLAFSQGGLTRLSVQDHSRERLSSTPYAIIAWGEPGIAAGHNQAERYRIDLFSSSSAESMVSEGEGTVVAMAWNGVELLALVTRESRYSFGINQTTSLLRWREGESGTLELLVDLTLDPSAPRFVDGFPYGPILEVSPFGDEILYTRLHDPPAFAPAYRAIVRHLASGRELLLGQFAPGKGSVTLSSDGEFALIDDGTQKITRRRIWGNDSLRLLDVAAKTLDASGDGIYADGRFFLGRELYWQLSAADAGVISPDGSRVAIATPSGLYLANIDAPPHAVNVTPERLRLRSLRAQGLISDADYLHYVKE